jgi:hypothetical protein
MAEKLIEAIGFDHNGKNYVIKVIQVGNKYTVIPYFNGMEASYYSYSVVLEKAHILLFKYRNAKNDSRLSCTIKSSPSFGCVAPIFKYGVYPVVFNH